MLIFSLHCQLFEYSMESPTDLAVDVDLESVGQRHSFKNCLYLLTSVEPHDGAKQVTRAARAIRKVLGATGAEQVVINGFATLAKIPAPAEHSQEILRHFAFRLGEREPELLVQSLPFGWRKHWTMDVVAGPWGQRCLHL
ncbi:MAG: hypothetical protein JWN03_4361 [Nocardia sp.]|uniref:threonyl-tRNA synthetase editing domain-containing protein n=1 Tax=Nocardia sp. TaxID=1821 RepID=UPI0026397823|nr:threonyl-tRNA synthetase editing domain-containing protein [Nocardia sp.]MCU1644086.1 hypothetical protein [Nocardia sp.]